jgi:protein-tyrosine phosphatase
MSEPYKDYDWITDRLAVGGFVHESHDELPFDAILSLETSAPAVLRDLVTSGRIDYQWRSIVDGICHESHGEVVRRFDEAAAQIDRWLTDDKRVLVHCYAGVSRSVTAVVWYFVRYHSLCWDEAMQLVRGRRQGADPAVAFEVALRLEAGEEISEKWIERRIEERRARLLELNIDSPPEEIWNALEEQGTFRRRQPA